MSCVFVDGKLDVMRSLLSFPKAVHPLLVVALQECVGGAGYADKIAFEGELIPLRICTESGVCFKRSINRGGKREETEVLGGFVLVFDLVDKVYLADLSTMGCSLTKRGFEQWAKKQEPMFHVHLCHATATISCIVHQSWQS